MPRHAHWARRLTRLRRSGVERFRQRGRAGMAWLVRLTAAAVASYEVARLLFPETLPLLAPLTALLVVQVTPVSLLASGLDRVLSVVLGVSVAVVFSSLFGLSWWSLGLVIGVSIAVGQILRLRSNLLEVPISAMLVLGVGAVGAAETAAWQRVAETIVGAGVGVLFNLLFPPKVATDAAGAALEGLGEDLALLLERAADELDDVDGVTRDRRLVDQASAWLDEARIITHGMPDVGAALLRAEESRRLNVRALARPDSGPGLRHGMESLEHASVTVRSMFRAILDAARQRDALDGFGPDLSIAYASVLRDFAEPLRTFGRLVRTEARSQDESDHTGQLRDALERILEARARLTDLVLADPRADPALNTLTITLLATADRLLRELDHDERARRTPPPLPQRFSLRDRRDRREEP